MRIKLLVLAIIWSSTVTFPSQAAKTLGQNDSLMPRVRAVLAARDVHDDRRFAELHLMESLQPMLQGFRDKFHQVETGFWIGSQVDGNGTIVARTQIKFEGQHSLTLAETYTTRKIDRLKRAWVSCNKN